MPNLVGKDGLYRKTESPVVESVRQTEGLYQKTRVAKVQVENPTEEQAEAVKTMEANQPKTKKMLKG